jgi:hypothetical protein
MTKEIQIEIGQFNSLYGNETGFECTTVAGNKRLCADITHFSYSLTNL